MSNKRSAGTNWLNSFVRSVIGSGTVGISIGKETCYVVVAGHGLWRLKQAVVWSCFLISIIFSSRPVIMKFRDDSSNVKVRQGE